MDLIEYLGSRGVQDQALRFLSTADAFAEAAHAGQIRKELVAGEIMQVPYIGHPRRVAAKVFLLKNDPAVIAAGLLHDVVEDCDVTSADIYARFGDKVGAIVDAVTDVYTSKAYPEHNRAARKHLELVRIREAFMREPDARIVKLCDVMDNSDGIHATGGRGWVNTWLREKAALMEVIMDPENAALD